MELTVEIQTGPLAGKKVLLRPGKIIQVGRTSWADLSVPQDSSMSGMHFAIECGSETCRVRDLKSTNGTLVNGARITEQIVGQGDLIVAGQTSFLVRSVSPEPPLPRTVPIAQVKGQPARPAPGGPQDLLDVLRSTPEPLFAILDAARDPVAILALLRGCGEEYQSLYEGLKGEELAAAAPYLVRLPPQSSFLETLVHQGWGKSWGIYLTCNQPFKEVRKHFRHFLLVKLEDGEEVYFRFYDPRVLRVFLPTCTPKETTEFFGPLRCLLLEDEKPETLLRFRAGAGDISREAVPLAVSGSTVAR